MVQQAKIEDIPRILEMILQDEKLDTDSQTFTAEYLKRMIRENVVLLSENGLLIGKYNEDEGWSDIIIDSAPKVELQQLIEAFRDILPQSIKTIDVFAHPEYESVYAVQGFAVGQKYTAMREHL